MRLYTIFWTYNGHEPENEVFAGELGTVAEGRQYLLNTYGGEGEYMDDPKLLTDVSVHPFTTVNSANGDPYGVQLII